MYRDYQQIIVTIATRVARHSMSSAAEERQELFFLPSLVREDEVALESVDDPEKMKAHTVEPLYSGHAL